MARRKGKITLSAKIAGYNESQSDQTQKMYAYSVKKSEEDSRIEGVPFEMPEPVAEPEWWSEVLKRGVDVGPNGLAMYRRMFENYNLDRSIRAGSYVTYTRPSEKIQAEIDAMQPGDYAGRSAGQRGARKGWGTSVFAARRFIARDPAAITQQQWGKFSAQWINPDEKSSIFLRMTQVLMPTGVVMDVCGTPRSTILSALNFLKRVLGNLPRDNEFSVWPLSVTSESAKIDEAVIFYTHFKS